jgi:DNA-binding CsgD family transcriptional regulator
MSLGNLATMARLDQLTLAIGEDSFGAVLVQTARAVGDVDHVMIFAFSGRLAPRLVVSAGAIGGAVATRAAAAYAEELYLQDPNHADIRRQSEGPARWFEFNEGREYDEEFSRQFLQPCDISDLLAFVVRQSSVTYYVVFARTGGRNFASAQRWLLNQVGEVIAAHVCKHFSYMHALKGENQFLINRVLDNAPDFAAITPRERLVCAGILTGHTSESIAMNLAISINSVLTYRKRLYEKLGISSQNELFARVITAMMELSRREGDAAPAALPDPFASRRLAAIAPALA